PWLYGVARRVALRARLTANRRREVPPVDVTAASGSPCPDLRPILDEAIARLPARDRTPVVLCYFEGLTYTEAAHRLRLPPGTISARLARARARLRVLLTRRGVVPAAGAVAAALAPDSSAAVVSLALRQMTVRAALGTATIPAAVLTLTKGVVDAMILNKVKLLATVFVLGTVGTGAWVYGPAAAQSPVGEVAPHHPPAAGEQSTAEAAIGRFQTPNFDVTAPTPEIARQVAEAAERARKNQAVLWLGKPMPTWSRRCPLTLKLTAGGTGGATKFNFDFRGNYQVLSMEFEGQLDKVLAICLPHEMTHTVLAHHFRYPVPRWADEGAAVLAEDESARRQHDRLIGDYLNRHQTIAVRRVFELKDYGEIADVMVLYAQGYSLSRFLIERKDRAAFLRFVDRGIAGKWDVAASVCYGFDSVEDLEAAWLADVRGKAVDDRPADRASLKHIPMASLRRPQPANYTLDTGDVLNVLVEGVVGERERREGTSVGYPAVALADGTLALPGVAPIAIRGQTVDQVMRKITEVFRNNASPRGHGGVAVHLVQPRRIRVTVVRSDLAGPREAPGRPVVTQVDLATDQNDVLNALAKGGGLPELKSNQTITIQRNTDQSTLTLRLYSPNGEAP
ncbi:MAG TPA: sigma factor-like helix-turn-helix DNA-binding protein, partial [Gemmataceae bacterium]|nr:sigma factor-like helix-turn-helix DNA-binding protein [Gemmataceae bacterium]